MTCDLQRRNSSSILFDQDEIWGSVSAGNPPNEGVVYSKSHQESATNPNVGVYCFSSTPHLTTTTNNTESPTWFVVRWEYYTILI